MQALIGCLMGAGLGLAAWLVVRAWPVPSQEPSAGRQPVLLAGLWGWRGVVVLPMCLALWGGYAGWQAAHPGRTALAVAFTGVLLLVSFVDLRVQRVPYLPLLLLLGLALAQALWLGKPAPWSSLLGLTAGGALLFLLSLPRRGALGADDIRLAAALGAMLGLPDILLALGAGILAGGAGALWLLATHRAGRRDRMAYAPYLALGAWLVWTHSFGLWP
jgi:leader peptidase (prepilin peptidase)/N-methyltransferase